ncbi:uncharacterized protein LOC143525753 isoform X2 [Brachyhypopomus gauderio]|uniref:uncharacterized protein LOC143525753 isoform X2 n=1 Tax=Brachyhypopomus gauderio TaxID=698409 RepID=UPI0040418251
MLVRLSCFLPALLFCSATTAGAKVTPVTSGETVTLKCPSAFEKNDTVDVEWGRDGGFLCKYQIKKNNITHYYYCSPQLKENSEMFRLTVTDVTSRDAGLYNCTVTRLIPPPSEDRYSTFRLEVNASLTLQHLNSSDVTCVDLLCSMEGLREEKLNFTWSKADKELLHLHNMNMRNMSSRLRLCEPAWRYGDTLTCHASYANDSVVYSRAITLTENSNTSRMVVVISIISSLGLLLLLLLLSVAVYKYRKRRMASEAVVFNNKVYENFSFFTARPNAEPSDVSYPRGNGRSNPQRAQGTQGEESIYEN